MSTVAVGKSGALEILRDVFGYPAFRGAQAEIIDHIGSGGDAHPATIRLKFPA